MKNKRGKNITNEIFQKEIKDTKLRCDECKNLSEQCLKCFVEESRCFKCDKGKDEQCTHCEVWFCLKHYRQHLVCCEQCRVACCETYRLWQCGTCNHITLCSSCMVRHTNNRHSVWKLGSYKN